MCKSGKFDSVSTVVRRPTVPAAGLSQFTDRRPGWSNATWGDFDGGCAKGLASFIVSAGSHCAYPGTGSPAGVNCTSAVQCGRIRADYGLREWLLPVDIQRRMTAVSGRCNPRLVVRLAVQDMFSLRSANGASGSRRKRNLGSGAEPVGFLRHALQLLPDDRH